MLNSASPGRGDRAKRPQSSPVSAISPLKSIPLAARSQNSLSPAKSPSITRALTSVQLPSLRDLRGASPSDVLTNILSAKHSKEHIEALTGERAAWDALLPVRFRMQKAVDPLYRCTLRDVQPPQMFPEAEPSMDVVNSVLLELGLQPEPDVVRTMTDSTVGQRNLREYMRSVPQWALNSSLETYSTTLSRMLTSSEHSDGRGAAGGELPSSDDDDDSDSEFNRVSASWNPASPEFWTGRHVDDASNTPRIDTAPLATERGGIRSARVGSPVVASIITSPVTSSRSKPPLGKSTPKRSPLAVNAVGSASGPARRGSPLKAQPAVRSSQQQCQPLDTLTPESKKQLVKPGLLQPLLTSGLRRGGDVATIMVRPGGICCSNFYSCVVISCDYGNAHLQAWCSYSIDAIRKELQHGSRASEVNSAAASADPLAFLLGSSGAQSDAPSVTLQLGLPDSAGGTVVGALNLAAAEKVLKVYEVTFKEVRVCSVMGCQARHG